MKKKVSFILGSSLLCMTLALPNISLAVFDNDGIELEGSLVRLHTDAYRGALRIRRDQEPIIAEQLAAQERLMRSIEVLIKNAREETGLNEAGDAWVEKVTQQRISLYSKQKANLEWVYRELASDKEAQNVIGLVLEKVQNIIEFWSRIPAEKPKAGSIFGRVSPDEWDAYETVVTYLEEGKEAFSVDAHLTVDKERKKFAQGLVPKALKPISVEGDLSEKDVRNFFPDRFYSDLFYYSRSHAINDEDQEALFRGLYGYISTALRNGIKMEASKAITEAQQKAYHALGQFHSLTTLFDRARRGELHYKSDFEAAESPAVLTKYVELFGLPSEDQKSRALHEFRIDQDASVSRLTRELQATERELHEGQQALAAELRALEEKSTSLVKVIEDKLSNDTDRVRIEAAEQRKVLEEQMAQAQAQFEAASSTLISPESAPADTEVSSEAVVDTDAAERRSALSSQIDGLKRQLEEVSSVEQQRIEQTESDIHQTLSTHYQNKSLKEAAIKEKFAHLPRLEEREREIRQELETVTRRNAFQQELLAALLNRGVEALVADRDHVEPSAVLEARDDDAEEAFGTAPAAEESSASS